MRISLGTMQMGGELSKEKSFELLNYYYLSGYYKFDTAQMYPVPSSQESFNRTENIIGEWVNTLSRVDKDKIQISTKFPNFSKKLNYLRKNNNPFISYEELKESLICSLRRLNIDCVETFFIHWPSREINNFGKSFYQSKYNENEICSSLEETYSNLLELAKEGLCKSVGISNETSIGLYCLKKISENFKQISLYIQNSYNLLNPTVDINISEFCLATNINMQAHSPLAFGVLTGKYRNNLLPKDSRRFIYPNYFDRYHNERTSALIECLLKICDSFELNLTELSYRYLLNNASVSEIIIGGKNILQIKEAISFLSKGELPREIYKEVFDLITNYSITAW
ncbi:MULTISPECIES: aldo/keto reductase [Prochlorococcus]|nr:aldo/keto reductase [Prochlorococcus marinus]